MLMKTRVFGKVTDLWDLEQIVKADLARNSPGELVVAIRAETSKEVGNDAHACTDARIIVGYYNPSNVPIFWRCVPSFVINVIQGWAGNPWMVDGYKFLKGWEEISSPSMEEEERAKALEDIRSHARATKERLEKLNIPVRGIMGSGRIA